MTMARKSWHSLSASLMKMLVSKIFFLVDLFAYVYLFLLYKFSLEYLLVACGIISVCIIYI